MSKTIYVVVSESAGGNVKLIIAYPTRGQAQYDADERNAKELNEIRYSVHSVELMTSLD